MSDLNKQVIEEFRANGGKVGGHFAAMKLLLLHTTGAKSGKLRINPAACMADGDRYVIIASKAGAPTHPDWYHNLVANPEVKVEVGTEQFHALATVAEEPEWSELYDKMSALYPFFSEYKDKTTRIIPVIVLTRQP
ncbi:MAG: nitroreductase family deazaflavin-dependent oxidoreductase [Chloroflexi bacterium]|nr:nitroreductase family deazaflavin-dependent oxidoreductase [Chloroflexota bacterium]